MNNKIKIAIDGPAGAGKSTISKRVADELGYIYIDTGAMYRAITLHYLKNGEKILNDLNNIHIDFKKDARQIVLLNHQDVTEDIRSRAVTNQVSHIASQKHVRKYLVERQRSIAKNSGVVMDGRDIGTTVLPDAELKIYLIATPEVRAERRLLQENERGVEIELEELIEQIKRRDYLDMNRDVSPLKKADDALILDSTNLTIEEVKSKILKLAHDKIKEMK